MRCLLLAVCLVAPLSWADPVLEISNAWQRGTPPGQSKTAAYMSITNPGASAVEVTGVSSAQARSVEIHESKQVDGMWQMRRLQSLPIAAGATVDLQPGGLHLMVFGLERAPKAGERVQYTLELSGGETVTIALEVRAPG